MTYKNSIKFFLILSLVALAGGGFFLHIRIHPFAINNSFLVASLSGVISIVVVPLLFCFRNTASLGYVLNGMLVIIGTVTMGHFSLVHLPQPLTISAFFIKTLFADILILWTNFFVGKALFMLEFHSHDLGMKSVGTSSRYPNNGWWAIHLILITVVYWAGHTLGR